MSAVSEREREKMKFFELLLLVTLGAGCKIKDDCQTCISKCYYVEFHNGKSICLHSTLNIAGVKLLVPPGNGAFCESGELDEENELPSSLEGEKKSGSGAGDSSITFSPGFQPRFGEEKGSRVAETVEGSGAGVSSITISPGLKARSEESGTRVVEVVDVDGGSSVGDSSITLSPGFQASFGKKKGSGAKESVGAGVSGAGDSSITLSPGFEAVVGKESGSGTEESLERGGSGAGDSSITFSPDVGKEVGKGGGGTWLIITFSVVVFMVLCVIGGYFIHTMKIKYHRHHDDCYDAVP